MAINRQNCGSTACDGSGRLENRIGTRPIRRPLPPDTHWLFQFRHVLLCHNPPACSRCCDDQSNPPWGYGRYAPAHLRQRDHGFGSRLGVLMTRPVRMLSASCQPPPYELPGQLWWLNMAILAQFLGRRYLSPGLALGCKSRGELTVRVSRKYLSISNNKGGGVYRPVAGPRPVSCCAADLPRVRLSI